MTLQVLSLRVKKEGILHISQTPGSSPLHLTYICDPTGALTPSKKRRNNPYFQNSRILTIKIVQFHAQDIRCWVVPLCKQRCCWLSFLVLKTKKRTLKYYSRKFDIRGKAIFPFITILSFFGLMFCFDGILAFVGNLMPKTSLKLNSIRTIYPIARRIRKFNHRY